jgi:hypothetical protein
MSQTHLRAKTVGKFDPDQTFAAGGDGMASHAMLIVDDQLQTPEVDA